MNWSKRLVVQIKSTIRQLWVTLSNHSISNTGYLVNTKQIVSHRVGRLVFCPMQFSQCKFCPLFEATKLSNPACKVLQNLTVIPPRWGKWGPEHYPHMLLQLKQNMVTLWLPGFLIPLECLKIIFYSPRNISKTCNYFSKCANVIDIFYSLSWGRTQLSHSIICFRLLIETGGLGLMHVF